MKISTKQAQSIVGTSSGRPSTDFYPTPRIATVSLLSVEQFDGGIWECACGKGDMSIVLEEYGYNVYSSDLYDYGYGYGGRNFLEEQYLIMPNIVTNPPFKLAEDFVSHAIFDLKCEKLTLLLKLAFLEGQARTKLLERTPLSDIYVFRKRLLMTRNGEKPRGSGMIAFAWFVWNRAYRGKPKISWV